MHITEERIGEALIVGLTGRMETLAALSLEQKINRAIDAGERQVVLYLAKLEYMSSSGLRTILGFTKRLNGEGGQFALTALTEPIRELITMARLEQIIPIFSTNKDAIMAFSRNRSGQE